jgi:acetate CoA/acetoacetate CoA-transferase alpha subunit
MPLPDKCCSIEAAIARIPDGARVMVGGFGVPGTPFCLLRELQRQGQRELTLIKNDANEVGMGVDWLLESGQVRRLITSHIGLNANAIHRMNTGRLEVVFVPQGILAERIRVAGAGALGFISDIGIGTALTEGRPLLTIDGRQGVVETALSADFALIHAAAADSFGNLRFAASARNFNPIMAMAAEHSIVEAETVLPLGAILPDDVHLPGPFVADVVALGKLPEVYGVVKR